MSTRSHVMPCVGEPGGGAVPERGGGGGLFVVVDLGVDEAGAVIDARSGCSGSRRRMAVGGASWPRPWIRQPPPSGIAGDLLDVDVDELAGPFTLVAAHRLGVGGPVAAIEPAQPSAIAGSRCTVEAASPISWRDVIGTPAALAAQLQHLTPTGRAVCGSVTGADATDRSQQTRRRLRPGTGRATCAPSSRRPGTAPRSLRSSSRARAHRRPSAGDPPGSTARSGAAF